LAAGDVLRLTREQLNVHGKMRSRRRGSLELGDEPQL
jgi:hypothetical protein